MILDGKAFAKKIKDKIKLEIENLPKQFPKPTLAVVIVGEDAASKIYVKNKRLACKYVGINSEVIELAETTTQAELEQTLCSLSKNKNINGILLQLPLPKGLNDRQALSCIDANKDVDGLSNINLGRLVANEAGLTPCTPTGIINLLKEYKIPLDGKHVVVINRSLLVGKPLEQMLINENATVTLCHSHTKNLKQHTKQADIIISAVGKRNFLTADMIKRNAIIIDVAIVRLENGICGDADFEKLLKKAKYITPVPGGVGPLTIATLLDNTIKAYKTQNNLNV